MGKYEVRNGIGIIPQGETIIKDDAFEDCKDLISISIPDSVTAIGNSVFWGCENLKEVTIPESVLRIGYCVFSGCKNLKKIVLPNSLESIDSSVFAGCENLKEVVLPNSITSIGKEIFGNNTFGEITVFKDGTAKDANGNIFKVKGSGMLTYDICDALESVYCYVKNPSQINIPPGAELNGYQATLYVPVGSVSEYKKREPWNKYASIKEIPSSMVESLSGLIAESSSNSNVNHKQKIKKQTIMTEKLERMINMALVDGVMDESDRQLINKVATAEGIDPDELQLYIKSIAKKQRNEHSKSVVEEQAQYIQKQRDAIGNECPKCHKQIPPMTLVCPYCGTAIVNKKANSSIKELAEKIDSIRSSVRDSTEKEIRIAETINLFPVPNTKEDILEFLALVTPNAKKKGGIFGSRGGRFAVFTLINLIFAIVIYIQQGNTYGFHDHELMGIAAFAFFAPFILIVLPLTFANWGGEVLAWNRTAKVWRAKYEQVMLKARSIRGDDDFQRQLDYYESILK